MRNKLIKLIKEKPSELLLKSEQDKGTKERFSFIKKSLLDNEYYLKKLDAKKKIINNSTLESSIINNDSKIKERSSNKGIIDFDKKVDSNQFPKESKIDEKYLSKIKEIEFNTMTYKKIQNNILALVVNGINKQTEDKLIFYDTEKKEKRMQITGYSFSKNEYNSEIIYNGHSIQFLCGCKNIKNKKNGILVINLEFLKYKKREGEKEKYINFYETGDFKVDSICHIIDNNNNDIKDDYSNDYMCNLVEYINKDFILVGGDKNNKGELKLFQLQHSEYSFNSEIRFLKDIVVEKNQQKGFKNSIDFIQQLKDSGKILVGSKNELYLFKAPNFEEYYNENECFSLSNQINCSILDRSFNSYCEDLISLSIGINSYTIKHLK